jgi:hypothetical protein
MSTGAAGQPKPILEFGGDGLSCGVKKINERHDPGALVLVLALGASALTARRRGRGRGLGSAGS